MCLDDPFLQRLQLVEELLPNVEDAPILGGHNRQPRAAAPPPPPLVAAMSRAGSAGVPPLDSAWLSSPHSAGSLTLAGLPLTAHHKQAGQELGALCGTGILYRAI